MQPWTSLLRKEREASEEKIRCKENGRELALFFVLADDFFSAPELQFGKRKKRTEKRFLFLFASTMRAACCSISALPVVTASAPGCSSGRRGTSSRSSSVTKRVQSPSSSVAVGIGGGDLLRRLALPAAASPLSSSRFRPPRRSNLLRQLSYNRPAKATAEGGDGGEQGDDDAPSTSSSSSSSRRPESVVEEDKKSKKQQKKAGPLGDLIAMISPARKREAGGPPPPTLSKRLRAIRGSLRALAEQAWRKTL